MLNKPINIDLHIHSAASQYKEPRGLTDGGTSKNCGVLLDKLASHEVSLFSITDHNRFDASLYRAFYSEIETRSLDVGLLAGVEFDVRLEDGKPGCHIITIFDADFADLDKIECAVEGDKLVGKGEVYERGRFEDLLKKIGLNTILIVHQHSGFGGRQRARSLGSAAEDGLAYYRFGYIDALEYNRPNVQGILRNELSNLDLPSNMLIGSDCHDWSSYPKHSPSAPDRAAFCARVKALPTFKGLILALTSPDTRFGSFSPQPSASYMKSLKLCGREVDLSPGVNAIIGENGVGKSSLLSIMLGETRKKWVKDVKEQFGVECPFTLDPSCTVSITQGQLQGKYEKGEIFEPGLFTEPLHQSFESVVDLYAEDLKRKVKASIARRDRQIVAKTKTFRFDEAMEGSTFHFTCSCEREFAEVDNIYTSQRNELRLVMEKLEEACKHKDVYTGDEIDILKSALEGVRSVYSGIDLRWREKDAEARVKGFISVGVTAYTDWLVKRSSDVDNAKAEYRKGKSEFVGLVMALARDEAAGPARIGDLQMREGWGEATKISQGFSFVKTARYAQTTDLTSEFFAIFNSRYKSRSSWEVIESLDDLAAAVPRASVDDWEEKFDAAVAKFKTEQEKCTPTILDAASRASGSTLGEMSLTYFRYKTSVQASSQVFVVDQPEDNISNKKIAGPLIDYFNSLRTRNQIIIVTHNPLLVVNQDVDNVIVLKNDANGKPAVTFGCLESESDGIVLDDVAELMDGGREAIIRRMKAYGSQA